MNDKKCPLCGADLYRVDGNIETYLCYTHIYTNIDDKGGNKIDEGHICSHNQLVAMTSERNVALNLLAQLVKASPMDSEGCCVFCQYPFHKDDCLITQARALIEERKR